MIARGKFLRGGGATQQKKATSHLKAHFKYIEHRSHEKNEEREERGIFSKDDDHVHRKEATHDVLEHTSNRVSYHKIVLSPGENEPVHDWRQWTRDVMADVEERQGKQLHWYAVHHSNTEHEHVHVVVAGTGEDRETGHKEVVTFYRQDYKHLRESGHRHSEHDFYRSLEEEIRALNIHDDLGKELTERELPNQYDLDREGGFER